VTTPAEPSQGDPAPRDTGGSGDTGDHADATATPSPTGDPAAPAAGGTPGEDGPDPVPLISAAPGTDGAAPSAVRPRRRLGWLRVLAACAALLVLALGGGTWYLYQRLNGNITTDTATETELKVHESERPTEGPTSAENILLIGSDNRGDGNEKYGQDSGTQRSDTTILLHLSADRSGATAISIPRDLMTHVPGCRRPDGSTASDRFEQFNWAFQQGGAACTIRTVENMTGVRIDHHLIVDFTGFKQMVNAVGGVEVCLPEAVHDDKAQLDLPAGRQKLNGEQALGYVRARYSIGDGSDTQRMERQQDFLASLLNKVRSDGVLLNPVKLYPLLDAATSSLTADPGLDSLSELYGLTQDLRRVPTGDVRFLTLPQEPYAADHNRDQLLQPDADRLFAALNEDRPVNVSGETASTGGTSSAAPTAGGLPTPTATYRGTTADRDVCGTAR
jgi:LCP family protein required for cell wall assembly